MLLRRSGIDPTLGTAGFRGSNVTSASDFSLSLGPPSDVLSSFSVSKWWSPAAPISSSQVQSQLSSSWDRLMVGSTWVMWLGSCSSIGGSTPLVRELSQAWLYAYSWSWGKIRV